MFGNIKISKRTKVIGTATIVAGIGTLVSTIKDLNDELELVCTINSHIGQRNEKYVEYLLDELGLEAFYNTFG